MVGRLNARRYADEKFIRCKCGRVEWKRWKDLGEIEGKLAEKVRKHVPVNGLCNKCLEATVDIIRQQSVMFGVHVLRFGGLTIAVTDPIVAKKLQMIGWRVL